MSDSKVTKHYADLVIAARGLGERLISTGIVDAEQLRFTIVAREDRKRLAPALKANGMSNREIARQLGVGHATINRDLAPANGPNDPRTGPNDPPKQQKTLEQTELERQRREAADVEKEKRETLLRLAEGAYRSAGAFAISQVRAELIDRLGDRKFTNMLAERLRLGVEGAPTIEEMLVGARELAKILKGVQS
jgi:transposase